MIETGYFTTSYVSSVDDSVQPFALWVPRTYSPRKKYPLIVALHGMDADHRMIPEECLAMRERSFREDVVLLCPFGRGDISFEWMGEADVWDTINWVKERYHIDARRQYLTGLSMGGFATWRLACAYPEQWAAIAPVCGGGETGTLLALKKIPVWCVHGECDEFVPVEQSRQLVAELRRLNFPHRYDELPGWGHNAWDWLYDPDRADDSLVDWLLQFRKSRAAAPVRHPRRTGFFKDLFNERVIISYPAHSHSAHETALLCAEAETIAQFSFDDFVMRSGRLLVKTDEELKPADLKNANHLMLGRVDNHRWLAKVRGKLFARHVNGRLRVRNETYLSKGLVAATCQPSPWNPARLLGIITGQPVARLEGIAERVCGIGVEPLAVNVYDPSRRRFIRQEGRA